MIDLNKVILLLLLLKELEAFIPTRGVFFNQIRSHSHHYNHDNSVCHGSQDVVVIGGGVGGLVCASLLATSTDWNITVLEKNAHVGGRMYSEHLQSSYRFDIGPSLLLLKDTYEKTFNSMNASLDDHVELLKVEPLYKCYFSDGTCLEIDQNEEKMRAQLDSEEKGAFAAYKEYMHHAQVFLDFGLPNVIEEKLSLKLLLPFLLSCLQNFPLLSHMTMLEKYFPTSPKLRAMMSFQDLYVGLSPQEAPAIFSLLQALEIKKGIYYPRGGFIKVAEALESVARQRGVEIKTESQVKHIKKDVDQQTYVVEYGEEAEYMHTRKVVTNIDAPAFENSEILQPDFRDLRVSQSRSSISVLSLSLALDIKLTCLEHHTLFFSDAYESSWDCVEKSWRSDDGLTDFDTERFNFYVHAPSRTDVSVCPHDHDAITVLVPIPLLPEDDDGGSDNDSYGAGIRLKIRSEVLRRLSKAQGLSNGSLEKRIVEEKMRSARSWRDEYSLYRGSAFGLSHELRQLSLFRPRIKHSKLDNVYRVGASVRPGNGVPLVMIGARLAADTILKDAGY